jgi:hypothetical protein
MIESWEIVAAMKQQTEDARRKAMGIENMLRAIWIGVLCLVIMQFVQIVLGL